MSGCDALALINPVAPRYPVERVREALAEAFVSRGLELRMLDTPKDGCFEFIVAEVARAVEEGCTRVIASGGDGTIAMVAEAISRAAGRRPSVFLGIIPGGTANVLARELGLPGDLPSAARIIAESPARVSLDAIYTGERHVLTQIGIGPDALMIRDTSRGARTKHGRLAYMWAFVQRAQRHQPAQFTLDVDGERHRARAWQIVLANVGAFGAPPFTWGPAIDPTDGTINLCVYNVRRPRDYWTLAWRILSGQHRDDVSTQFHQARKEVTVTGSRALLVQGDGEIIGRTPMTFRVVRKWVHILVADPTPAPAAEAASPAIAIPSESEGEPEAEPDLAAVTAAALETPKPVEQIEASSDTPSITEDAKEMVAGRSRTWLLQGLFSHPIAAFNAFDAAIFLRVNNLVLPRAADAALSVLTRMMHHGEGWLLVALYVLAFDRTHVVQLLFETLPALGLTILVVNLPAKALFRRRRPFHAFVKARVIGVKPLDFSLPSGHTAAGFAGALLFTPYLPGAAPLFYAIAAVVGMSRIYFGVHYPSDVALGAAIGTLLAIVFRALLRLVLAQFG